MPIPYKQLDRSSGQWVTKYKEISIEGRRPMTMMVEPKKKAENVQEVVYGVFKATKKALTSEDVLSEVKGQNKSFVRWTIYQLCKIGRICKTGTVINNGKRCNQYKLKVS